jgi:MFS family permease
MSLGAIGAYALWHGEGLPIAWRFTFVVLFSAVGGLIPGTLFACAMRLAPSEGSMSTTVGFMQQWSALGQFAGPPAVAWVAARAGGWQWTWTVSVAFSLIGMWLAHQIHLALQMRATRHD